MVLCPCSSSTSASEAGRSSMVSQRSMQAAMQCTARALRSTLASPVGPGTSQRLVTGPMGRASFAVKARQSAGAPPSDDDLKANKAKALEAAIKTINSKCGAGTMQHFGPDQEFEQGPKMSTGAMTLDYALGGGIPEGKIVEIYGMESSGKTTLAMHAMREAQKKGGIVVMYDLENGWNVSFAKAMGIDQSRERFQYSTGGAGEDVFFSLETMICSGAVSMITVDSVSAIIPRSELEGDIGSPVMGGQARLMSTALKRIQHLCGKHKVTIIFLNQIRNKIIAYGNPETTSGGVALNYYASMRIRLSRVTKASLPTDKNGDERGIRVKAQVMKNKCAPPFKTAEFDILWDSGISAIGCMLDVAEKVQVVTRKGSWYYFADSQLAQGREKVVALLTADPELEERIKAETQKQLSGRDVGSLFEPGKSLDEDDELSDEVVMAE